jgi:DNA repair photolyase
MQTGVQFFEKSISTTKKLNTKIIYEARGRAKEYSELAANLYRGCGHGCTYCYAPAAIHVERNAFYQPIVREDVLTKLEKDAQYLEEIGEKRTILLSFTTDPYQPLDEKMQLTRNAIRILHEHKLKISILTKGGARSERDFDLLVKNPNLSEYGVTLVFSNEDYREKIEPFAARTIERIESLKKAHDLGIFTYVSLEPVWFADNTLKLIDLTHDYVDFYKVGKINHHPQANCVDWKKFKADVIEKLEVYQKDYYIKKDLQPF